MPHPRVRVSIRELAMSVAELEHVTGRVNGEQVMVVLGGLGALLRAADARHSALIYASLIDQAGTHVGESPYRAELRGRLRA